MPIDLTQVDWLYLIVLSFFVFVACLIGSLLAYNSRTSAAAVSALLFAIIFVAWTYYPHGLPLPTHLKMDQPEAVGHEPVGMPSQSSGQSPNQQPSQPVRPKNPVTDITPPRNPVTDITPPGNR